MTNLHSAFRKRPPALSVWIWISTFGRATVEGKEGTSNSVFGRVRSALFEET